jgi:hypothetical protein
MAPPEAGAATCAMRGQPAGPAALPATRAGTGAEPRLGPMAPATASRRAAPLGEGAEVCAMGGLPT